VGPIEISEGIASTDFDQVHLWLASSYWSPGIARELVEKAAMGSSLVVNARLDGLQVGYLRVVSDKTTFGWICDVFVDESARGRGIAKEMVRYALQHPEHQGFRRWVLATRDAHEIYAACGFEALWEPQRWMIHFPGGTPVQIG
jgi:GNAT superfamily N-acetyltransferase